MARLSLVFVQGEQTARFIDKGDDRLTLAGRSVHYLYLSRAPVPDDDSGTSSSIWWHSLLIIVVVIMDFMAQVQTHLMSHQYGDVLRKANLKGFGR